MFTDYVRKGRARYGWNEGLEKMDVPKDVRDACEKYCYLWPQSAVIDHLVGYAICAYYQINAPAAYHDMLSDDTFRQLKCER